MAALFDHLQVRGLLAGDALGEDLAEADDGGERGADLVAHVGQERALEAGGLLGMSAGGVGGVGGFDEGSLVLELFGDVADDAVEAGPAAPFVGVDADLPTGVDHAVLEAHVARTAPGG